MCCQEMRQTPWPFFFELNLIFDGHGEQQGWLEPTQFAAPLLALRMQLDEVWVCWVVPSPCRCPHELFCFQKLFLGFVFQRW